MIRRALDHPRLAGPAMPCHAGIDDVDAFLDQGFQDRFAFGNSDRAAAAAQCGEWAASVSPIPSTDCHRRDNNLP